MTPTSRAFSAVKTEGGLLPQDLLSRIQSGDTKLPGTGPETYHLAQHERIGEAANRAWSRLVTIWHAFQEALEKEPEDSPATGLTRERWLLPLFQELGYGRLPKGPTLEADGKSFAISHTWNHSPIHLLGCRVDLDRRQKGVAGAAKSSPHGLVQEFLNRSEDHLWGFVTNGYRLRVLRDHHSLTRQSYVEFDLQTILDGEQYSEFLLLWLVCHQSRVEAEQPDDCWLETWANISREEGVRALDKLRDGVEKAIEAFGTGFLIHPANTDLRAALESGELDKQEYYRQLLRLVYRLIFLFVAEERDALLDPHASEDERGRYRRYYDTRRIRNLAEKRRGGPHGDLWRCLALVIARLNDGYRPLALPALGSRLWGPTACPTLMKAECANEHFLRAIRYLSQIQGRVNLYSVNWRNVGADELGSVYEGLLELHPCLNREAGTFELGTAAGHERKSTGSYYTPADVVDTLLQTTLDPLLDEACAQNDSEAAILDLKVCDPACGSGHFLVAASHRIARRLASVRSGDDEPSPRDVQRALRDVVGQCVYGVDINPMAVELCKVGLWMEALEPGKPLSFLDSHVQAGDALLGATPALMARGIPDDAFKPVIGEDKEVARRLRARNREERKGQSTMFAVLEAAVGPDLAAVAVKAQDIEATTDNDISAVRQKEGRWEMLSRSAEWRDAQFCADAWCAAFDWSRQSGEPEKGVTTQDTRRRLESDVSGAGSEMRRAVSELAHENRFFHWHLAFPHVFDPIPDGHHPDDTTGWNSHFDVILSNPPWISFTGRQKVETSGHALRLLRTRYPCIARWPASHSAMLVLSVQLLRSGGRAGVVLPRQVADLAAYGPVRAAVTSRASLTGPVVDVGEDAFPHVTQPVGLYSLRVDGGEACEDAWDLSRRDSRPEATTTDANSGEQSDVTGRIIARFTDEPQFAAKTFTDPGVHTGNVAKKIILSRAPLGRRSEYADVREGKNIAAFCCGEPRKVLWLRPDLEPGEYCRVREWRRYADVPILVRQTANRPIATRHCSPTYFRNSLLACHGVQGVPDTVVVAFLNSGLYALLHRATAFDAGQKAFPQVKVKHLHNLPTVPVDALGREAGAQSVGQRLDKLVLEAESSATLETRPPLELLMEIERLVLSAFDLSPDLAPELLDLVSVP